MEKQIAAYVGSAVAIVLGVAMLYYPPAGMGGQSGTVAFATAMIVGGLAALGVTVAVPAVREQARRVGRAEGAIAAARTGTLQ